jgi:stage II sporulation protein D
MLLLLSAVGIYLSLDLPIWRSGERIVLGSSPELRLLFQKDLSEMKLKFPSSSMEIWLSGASRPIQWKKQSGAFFVSREASKFRFGGYKEPLDWVHLKPSNGKFVFGKFEYEGSLWLYPKSENTFDVVLILEMEKYIAKVIDREMSSHWPLESLKAQAIAARSFAYYHLEKNRDKAYHLLMGPQAQALTRAQPSNQALKATEATFGMVLKQSGHLFLAYYHSTCGGQTKAGRQGVFEYKSVECQYCRNSPHYHWSVKINQSDIENMFSSYMEKGASLVHAKTIVEASGHVSKVVFTPEKGKAIQIDALDLRRHLNRSMSQEVIKSLRFDLHFNQGQLKILGRGWGYHGLGMCQYGARGLAEHFWTCRSILEFYYPGTTIEVLQTPKSS